MITVDSIQSQEVIDCAVTECNALISIFLLCVVTDSITSLANDEK